MHDARSEEPDSALCIVNCASESGKIWPMRDAKDNLLKEKSYAFALRIISLYKHLTAESKEYVLSKQVLRSGTSVGPNITEANRAQSKMGFRT
jgi:hypothetical protein